MSIASEISRIAGNVSDSLTAVSNKGVTVPAGSNSDDLAGLIAQIQQGGGGSTLATETGTFTGSGGNTVQISCPDFAPIAVCVRTTEIAENPSLRGIVSFSIIKDNALYVTADSSTSQAAEYLLYAIFNFTDYNAADTGNPHASYSNGVLTLNTVYNSGTARFPSGVTYSYTLIGVTGGD